MPDPVVLLPELEEERDFLFDIRTGYAVLDKEVGHFDDHPYGEGNPKWYAILRCQRKDVPDQWSPWGENGRRRIRKLDLTETNKLLQPVNRIKSGLLSNVYKVKPVFTEGSDEDFKTEIAKYDTRQNAVGTTGTGYTFATIQANINSLSSGDIAAIYGNGATPLVSGDYNENITDNGLDGIQVIGMLESDDGIMPAIRVRAGAGIVFSIAGQGGWFVENFEIYGEGTAQYGLLIQSTPSSTISRCVIHSFITTGLAYLTNSAAYVVNSIAYDSVVGFSANNTSHRFIQCTAIDNSSVGFAGTGVSDLSVQGCLASDNGTDYTNPVAAICAWNVSSDLTAPGSGSRTGFTNNNFVNYAGDDFRLNYPQNATGANIDGWPLVDVDYLLNTREKDTLIFYAGAHDPYVPPTGADVTCLGIMDAAPAAQGSIWIRFYEMCITGDAVPYRYDVHVKRFDNGPLTAAEINAGTYYARSFYADELNGCGGDGSPPGSGGLPGLLQALINFEAPEDITPSVIPNDENMHLFTARQYWIAIRAVAIDANNVIYEDGNTEVALSYSPGHQGELWTQIIGWPCLELCAGNPVQNVNANVSGSLEIDGQVNVVVDEINDEISAIIPPLDAIIRAGDHAGPLGPQGG